MRLGVMTSVLPRPSIEAVAEAVRAAGLDAVQLNLEFAGLEALPESLDEATARRIGAAFTDRGIEVAAVSGTFNAIDADPARRAESDPAYWRSRRLLRVVGDTGYHAVHRHSEPRLYVAAPSGQRPPGSLGGDGRDHARPRRHAEAHGVDLAFEPRGGERGGYGRESRAVDRRVGSPRLRLVMDPANYFHPEMLSQMREVLEDVFARVGRHIALAHAKDVRPPDPGNPSASAPPPAPASWITDLRPPAPRVRLHRRPDHAQPD